MLERPNSRSVRSVVRRLSRAGLVDDLGNVDDPLDELVFIVLSARTRGPVFKRTFDTLKQAVPAWQNVLEMTESELADLITPAGLQLKKARWLRQLVEELESRQGVVSLDCLQAMSTPAAEVYLTSLPGVGIKTARCVLMYSLGRAVFPVDAHVYRLFVRLGFADPEVEYRQSHELLQEMVPEDLRRDLHVLAVLHGRTTCLPRHPRCERCPLAQTCYYARRTKSTRKT